MKAIGIDIGTTTICGILIDAEEGTVLDVITLPNTFELKGAGYERLQDPGGIIRQAEALYRGFLGKYDDICSIGITGQMHGIVYTDAKGQAVSPLYTWQDESGNEPAEECPGSGSSSGPVTEGCENLMSGSGPTAEESENPVSGSHIQRYGKSTRAKRYVDVLNALTGYPSASGFGTATFFVHSMRGQVPETAVSFCTIPDYCAMRLTGRTRPLITPSMGASLGCFDLKDLAFDVSAVQAAGMDVSFLPECRNGYIMAGRTKEGIPVSAAIGDNQASVIGSVKDLFSSVLINVGTGSQVSVGIDHYCKAEHVELRPLAGDAYILAGSSLCGGRAYAALERFFEDTVEAMTGKRPGEKLYDKMSCLLEQTEESCKNGSCNAVSATPEAGSAFPADYAPSEAGSVSSADSAASGTGSALAADTRLCGTREDPSLRGAFTNLSLENFTPRDMIMAVLKGIAEELNAFHAQMIAQGAAPPAVLVGSGNGLRRNRNLRQIFEKMYHLPMLLPQHSEEAAFGAALYSMCAAGIKKDLKDAQQLIRYENTG